MEFSMFPKKFQLTKKITENMLQSVNKVKMFKGLNCIVLKNHTELVH